jgi:hypothetical protein
VRIARSRYPNLSIAYLSSRTRAYTTDPQGLNPEPFAYESGLAVKWLIEDQISGDPLLVFAGAGAPAPWLAWGPYLWADGEVPRSDGFVWECSDTASDFTHPSTTGSAKVADQLMTFLWNEPTARPWFRAPRKGCGLVGIEPLLALFLARSTRRLAGRARTRLRLHARALIPESQRPIGIEHDE